MAGEAGLLNGNKSAQGSEKDNAVALTVALLQVLVLNSVKDMMLNLLCVRSTRRGRWSVSEFDLLSCAPSRTREESDDEMIGVLLETLARNCVPSRCHGKWPLDLLSRLSFELQPHEQGSSRPDIFFRLSRYETVLVTKSDPCPCLSR